MVYFVTQYTDFTKAFFTVKRHKFPQHTRKRNLIYALKESMASSVAFIKALPKLSATLHVDVHLKPNLTEI